MSNRSTIFDDVKPMYEKHAAEITSDVTPIKITTKARLGLQNVTHDVDPREFIMSAIGPDILNKIRVFGAKVLVATYVRPNKIGSLYISESVQEEDKFQGKCGLVIKMGPLAFQETEKLKFAGCKVNIGDWAWYSPVNGRAISLAGVSESIHCRFLDDVDIEGDLDHPDVIM